MQIDYRLRGKSTAGKIGYGGSRVVVISVNFYTYHGIGYTDLRKMYYICSVTETVFLPKLPQALFHIMLSTQNFSAPIELIIKNSSFLAWLQY
ncbi:MAG TPA: hypothetical protein PKA39_08890 [Ignavibacteria bacterium]|nr:hypothetical protein [Ignavibacteria bacterium]